MTTFLVNVYTDEYRRVCDSGVHSILRHARQVTVHNVSRLTGLGFVRSIDRTRFTLVLTASRLSSVPVRRTKTWTLGSVQLFMRLLEKCRGRSTASSGIKKWVIH